MSKLLEYLFVAYFYVRGPFAWVVGFVRQNPKTTLVIFAASHIVRGLL